VRGTDIDSCGAFPCNVEQPLSIPQLGNRTFRLLQNYCIHYRLITGVNYLPTLNFIPSSCFSVDYSENR